jgi:hypothetical protein
MSDIRKARKLTILEVPENGLTGEWLRPIEKSFVGAGLFATSAGGGIARFLGKSLNKFKIMRNLADLKRRSAIVQIPQLAAYRAFPYGLWGEIIPDCFDCWEPDYPEWEDFLRRMSVKTAFFSARQSAKHMSAAVPGLEAIWAPEGIDPKEYVSSKPLADRTIDVLEMGRKNDAYHSQIDAHCAKMRYSHLFEKIRGVVVFPHRADMLEGLANTKISICFPSSITHPDRSGSVETLTQRYLESIASGAVLLGKCPGELRDLFEFDPVIEIDERDPTAQLDYMIANIGQYEDLTKRSLARLHQVGTLQRRTTRILSALQDRNYEI